MVVVADLSLTNQSQGIPTTTSLRHKRCRPTEADDTRVLFSFPLHTCGSIIKVPLLLEMTPVVNVPAPKLQCRPSAWKRLCNLWKRDHLQQEPAHGDKFIQWHRQVPLLSPQFCYARTPTSAVCLQHILLSLQRDRALYVSPAWAPASLLVVQVWVGHGRRWLHRAFGTPQYRYVVFTRSFGWSYTHHIRLVQPPSADFLKITKAGNEWNIGRMW